jgi:hypothetical protein
MAEQHSIFSSRCHLCGKKAVSLKVRLKTGKRTTGCIRCLFTVLPAGSWTAEKRR